MKVSNVPVAILVARPFESGFQLRTREQDLFLCARAEFPSANLRHVGCRPIASYGGSGDRRANFANPDLTLIRELLVGVRGFEPPTPASRRQSGIYK